MKEEIVYKAIKGDKEAFTSLIESLEDTMYKISRVRLDSEDDIYDSIQESVISAYNSIHNLKNPQFFKTWIIKILINKCNDIYVRNNLKKRFLEKISKEKINEENEYEKIEGKLEFENIIKFLNYKEKIILTLYYSEDLTIKEISKILKINENTVKTKMLRAKEKIKKRYEGGFYG